MTDDAVERNTPRWRGARRWQDAAVAAQPIVAKGLLIVHTGKGKGKSTAAFGLALARARARPARRRGAVHQGRLGDRRARRHSSASAIQMVWRTMGEGFTWETQDRARDVAAARAAWAEALKLMADPTIRLARARRTQHRAAL